MVQQTQKKEMKVKYLNKHNLQSFGDLWLRSGYKSVIVWLFVFLGFGTYGIIGSLTVAFVATISMIAMGIRKGLWKPYNPEGNLNETNSERSGRSE